MRAKDIMTENPERVQTGDSIKLAGQKLFELDIRHLPVMKGEELVGILSDRDIMGHQWQNYLSFVSESDGETYSDRPVSEVMSGAPISVGPESELTEVIDCLVENKVGAVMVIDPEQAELIGIISYVDILNAVKELV